MALLFDGTSAWYVNHGSDTSLDNIDPITTVAWAWADSNPSSAEGAVWGKDANNNGQVLGQNINPGLRMFMRGTLTRAFGTAPTVDIWSYMAGIGVQSGGASGDQKVFLGDLTTMASDVTQGTNYNSGTMANEGGNLIVGNWDGSATDWKCWEGKIALVGIWNSVLTLEQIRQQQFSLFPVVDLANLRFFVNFGWNGTSTQPDWSGKLNNGTVTGATLTDHVPLGLSRPPGYDQILVSDLSVDISESNYNAWIPGVKVRG